MNREHMINQYDTNINVNNYSADEVASIQQAFITKTFMWMGVALALTGLISWLTINSETLIELVFSSRLVFFGILIAEVGIVIYLSSAIQRMSAQSALGWFLFYSALNGITLSLLFMIYTAASVTSAFMVTALTFAGMAMYGYTTKRDLTTIGSLAFMGLIGIIIASVINIFFFSETLYWIISYVGVLIFVGLTAYDTQKLKEMSLQLDQNEEIQQKAAIMGALRLYLDFINLFIMLLRIMGRRN